MRQTWKLLFVLAGLIGAVEPLTAAHPIANSTATDDMGALIREARDGYRPATAAELARARQAVQTACQALDRKLSAQPDGRGAKAAVNLEELSTIAAAPSADLDRLDVLARHLGHRSHGVKGAELDALRTALCSYQQQLRAGEGDETAAEYLRQIDRLATAWENYRRSHEPATGVELQTICRWLEERGQAEPLCQRLRREASHANHRMHVSAAFVEQALTREISQPLVSNEVSQGAQVRLQGQLKGKLTPTLEPNARAGVVRVRFIGQGESQIVAHKGRVMLQAHGHTGIHATEAAYLTERGLSTSAPQVAVQHRSVPYAASVDSRSRLVRRLGSAIVMRVAGRKQAESDQQASRNTQKKIDAEVRRQSAKIVHDANDVIERFGVLALLGKQPAETLKINTTRERIEWLGRYASASQFAAETPAPPVAAAAPAVLLQLHESAANNSENWLADATISDSDFRELAFETFGLIPAGQDQQSAQIPATITFADERPLEVRVDNDRVDVTLRLKAFACEGRTFDQQVWTARTSYQPQLAGGKVELVRTAGITVQGVSAEGVEPLQTSLARFLVEKASPRGAGNPALASLPPLTIGQLSLNQGWLTLALVLDPKVAAPAARLAAN